MVDHIHHRYNISVLHIPFHDADLCRVNGYPLCALLYGVKIIWWTGRDDNGRKRSFLESAKDTVSHIPEFFGVANYYLWSRRQRAKA